ncbi:MAG: hypothetical protein ACREFJ_08260 [Acetobacteraceae bacterium]
MGDRATASADPGKAKEAIVAGSAVPTADQTLRAPGGELHRPSPQALGYDRSKPSGEIDLDDDKILFLQHYPPPHVFSVISWGCAATGWLAYALNSHPDIYCVHAANTFWSRLGEQRYVDGISYLRIIGSQGYAYKAAGDVHGVSRQAVAALRKAFGGNFGCAVVVRDPLPRLRSQVALFEAMNYDRKSWGDLAYLNGICKSAGISLEQLSDKQRFFVHGVNMLNAITDEANIATIYRSEDLTSAPGKLRQLITEITNDKVSVSDEWAEAAVARRRINSHGSSSAGEFDDWQRHVVQAVVTPEAWKIYRSLGYECEITRDRLALSRMA